jgi:hypothetical protein
LCESFALPNRSYFVIIRFFETIDRFPGLPAGHMAQRTASENAIEEPTAA